jgi:hypothetical protein
MILNPLTGRYIKKDGILAKSLYRKGVLSGARINSNLTDISQFIDNGYSRKIDHAVDSIDYTAGTYDCIAQKLAHVREVLEKHNVVSNGNIETDLLKIMVPPGLKAAIRGNRFNHEILSIIKAELGYDSRFTICSEVKVPELNEKLDFYVHDAVSGKSLYGYNQIDLWSGGHQTNRADKYVLSDSLHAGLGCDKKLICVIQRYVQVRKTGNKLHSIFETGIAKERLFYPGHLGGFLLKYFDIQGNGL